MKSKRCWFSNWGVFCALSMVCFAANAHAEEEAAPQSNESSEVRGATSTDHPEKHDHQHSHRHKHTHAHQGHHNKNVAVSPEYQTTVTGARPIQAASAADIRDRDLKLRPIRRPADILSVTPGLFVVQHAGGGKANQYFLRGFDLDHGTDLAIFVDGIPVNAVSHGHGQGYADLNWLIPEVVERVQVRKGPYFAEYGDFATSGAVNLVTRDNFETNKLEIGGGMFESFRGVVAMSPKLEDWRVAVAGEIFGTNGPFINGEGLRRFSLFSKITRVLDDGSLITVGATAYGSGWNASGQIPRREVRAGRLDRFDAIDRNEGGDSQRYSVFGSLSTFVGDGRLTASVYWVRSLLSLYSNFTFFSRDPVNGDMIEQTDSRSTIGLNSQYQFFRSWNDIRFDTKIGIQSRADFIDVTLFDAPARERSTARNDSNIGEAALSFYAEETITWLPWLRTVFGVRGDYFGFDVEDRLEDTATLGTKSSGTENAIQVSPKASVIFSPLTELDIYLNFGRGFHSNDARGVVLNPGAITPIAGATGYEVGVRSRLFDRLDLAAAFFGLHLEQELVWIGDEGATEPSGRTFRYGGEIEARLQILPWLYADADVTLTSARFVDEPSGNNAVPLAPRFFTSGGISARHSSGLWGRFGVVYLDDRPATEDNFIKAESFVRSDLTLGYRHRDWFEVSLSVQNLFDTSWNEAQFATTSRLQNESAASACPAGTRSVSEGAQFVGCEDLNFTPGWPINVQGSVALFF